MLDWRTRTCLRMPPVAAPRPRPKPKPSPPAPAPGACSEPAKPLERPKSKNPLEGLQLGVCGGVSDVSSFAPLALFSFLLLMLLFQLDWSTSDAPRCFHPLGPELDWACADSSDAHELIESHDDESGIRGGVGGPLKVMMGEASGERTKGAWASVGRGSELSESESGARRDCISRGGRVGREGEC